MGLDTSHNCWHGPYSLFSRWRQSVAEAAGYQHDRITENGFTFHQARIDWDGIMKANPGCIQGEWVEHPNDPLLYLIAHSDYDGVIHPSAGTKLADRLEELLPKLKDGGPWSDRDITEQFISGLRLAASAGEDVDFH